MANSTDPDQLASSEANWSGSTLFAKAGYIRVHRTRVNQVICSPQPILYSEDSDHCADTQDNLNVCWAHKYEGNLSDFTDHPFFPYDTQCMKSALMQFADNKGPDKPAHSGWSGSSLPTYRINVYHSVCQKKECLDQTAWMPTYMWTFLSA